MSRDNFTCFKNWVDTIRLLPDVVLRDECWSTLAEYNLTGEMPENMSPICRALMQSFSISIQKRVAKAENGKKGGEIVKQTQANASKPQNDESKDEIEVEGIVCSDRARAWETDPVGARFHDLMQNFSAETEQGTLLRELCCILGEAYRASCMPPGWRFNHELYDRRQFEKMLVYLADDDISVISTSLKLRQGIERQKPYIWGMFVNKATERLRKKEDRE